MKISAKIKILQYNTINKDLQPQNYRRIETTQRNETATKADEKKVIPNRIIIFCLFYSRDIVVVSFRAYRISIHTTLSRLRFKPP